MTLRLVRGQRNDLLMGQLDVILSIPRGVAESTIRRMEDGKHHASKLSHSDVRVGRVARTKELTPAHRPKCQKSWGA